MPSGCRSELIMALAWLAFPLVPVMLEDFYYQMCGGPDPTDWDWVTWLLVLGPLVGYGFLAGSTAEVGDDVSGPRKGLRRLVARRAVWVAIGPWGGFLLLFVAFFVVGPLIDRLPLPRGKDPFGTWRGTWAFAVLSWTYLAALVGVCAYGWLWPAWAALRRAGRVGLGRRALSRGIVTAMAFVGSLFGSFWAIIASWRGYFFDPRVVPLIALAVGVTMLSGCSSTITYGEVRRRELFHAMLLAWVFGLALIWWWSSRRARQRPRP